MNIETETRETRLCYIEDINKAQKYLMKRTLSPEEFDFLYEQSLDGLELILMQLEITISQVDSLLKH